MWLRQIWRCTSHVHVAHMVFLMRVNDPAICFNHLKSHKECNDDHSSACTEAGHLDCRLPIGPAIEKADAG